MSPVSSAIETSSGSLLRTLSMVRWSRGMVCGAVRESFGEAALDMDGCSGVWVLGRPQGSLLALALHPFSIPLFLSRFPAVRFLASGSLPLSYTTTGDVT